MGFLQILRSIEDLLYEVMTWLVFYPRTFWKTLVHPVKMIDYSDVEQNDAPDDQYTDSLSPPLFLLLSIIITHVLERTFQAKIDRPKSELAAFFSNSDEGLIILQTILFSIYPLIFAVGLLKRTQAALDRKTLRGPFFSQCYLGAVFAVFATGATIMIRNDSEKIQIAGTVFGIMWIAWYVAVQTKWFQEHLNLTTIKSFNAASLTFIKASIINSGIAALFFV